MRRPLPFIITNSKLPSSIPHISEKQRKLVGHPTLIGSSDGLAVANFGFFSPPVMRAVEPVGLGVRPVGLIAVQLLVTPNSP